MTRAVATLPPWTRELIACLREPERQAFVLRHGGMTFQAISESLHVPEPGVRDSYAVAERQVQRAARRGARALRSAQDFLQDGAPPLKMTDERRSSLDIRVDELDISVRVYHLLERANVRHVGELARMSIARALKLDLGRKGVRELQRVLAVFGLQFGMDVGDWQTESERLSPPPCPPPPRRGPKGLGLILNRRISG